MSESFMRITFQMIPLYCEQRKIFKFWNKKAESMKEVQETSSSSFFSSSQLSDFSKPPNSYSSPLCTYNYAESITIQRANEIPSHLYCPPIANIKFHFSPNFYDIRTISAKTLSAQMQSSNSMLIIDCRSKEEYQANHVVSSFNGPDCTSIIHRLFENKKEFVNLISHSTIIVIYCKNGKDLSPFVLRLLRQVDRIIHRDKYPLIAFSELYLLNKGYKKFSTKYPVNFLLGFMLSRYELH